MNEEIKIELTRLRTYRNQLWNKRTYLRDKIKNYKDLQNRSKCPCCRQPVNREHYKLKIPKTEEGLARILNVLEGIYPQISKLEVVIADENYIKQKEKREKVQGYLKINRSMLNKAIRDYNKGVENYLPNIPDSDKELWNSAMEFQLDNRNMDENEELLFEGY